jgi:hypothetical protein
MAAHHNILGTGPGWVFSLLEVHCRKRRRNVLLVQDINAGQKDLVIVYIFPSLDRTELSSSSHVCKEERGLTRATWLEQLATDVGGRGRTWADVSLSTDGVFSVCKDNE